MAGDNLEHDRGDSIAAQPMPPGFDTSTGRPARRADVEDVIDQVDAHYRELEQLVSAFPEAERAAARAGLYRDADGQVRTRHRLLRVVTPDERAEPQLDDFDF